MEKVIELFKRVLVQIATPYNVGTGFWWAAHRVIVTNEHIVRDNKEVVIDGQLFEQCTAHVIFADAKYDIAFLQPPSEVAGIPHIEAGLTAHLSNTSRVFTMGHPSGEAFAIAEGTIEELEHLIEDIPYIRHTASLSQGYSGGPLIDAGGHLLGVNTFLLRDGQYQGLSLPVEELSRLVAEFEAVERAESIRCLNCEAIIVGNRVEDGLCPGCGVRAVLPSQVEAYEASGIAKTIEEMLKRLKHDVDLSRRGPNNWKIRQGSAKIDISYYEKSGLIIGDAYLCKLPPGPAQPLLHYLLRQNYEIENLTFSIKGQDIILSLLIFDRYLNVDSGLRLFQYLFDKADYFDNILVEQYEARWSAETE